MKIIDIYTLLDSLSPFEYQESWDNSGLNIGSLQNECSKIYVSLELDFSILDNIENDSLIITHHPVIFKPIKNFLTNEYPCNLISQCNKKNISLISMHTNFDKTHLNTAFVKTLYLEKLGFSESGMQDFSAILESKNGKSIENIAKHIKDSLKLDILRYSKANENLKLINKIYITCGSNASSHNIAESNSLIITGDIKYHDAKMANSKNINFIDVPHYESEKIFNALMQDLLSKNNIQSSTLESYNPFSYI